MAYDIDGPIFAAVFALRVPGEGFVVEGIFSKDDDAEEFRVALEASPFVRAVAPAQHMPMKAIIDKVIEARLKDLAKPVMAIASRQTS